MSKYATKLTKDDLIRAGIKDIYYDSDEAKYHIIRNDGEEVKLYKGKKKYLYFAIYIIDENGDRVKKPITRKRKNHKKEINTYKYKTRLITLHRGAYAWFKGEVPEGYIVDHIDNKHDTHYDSRISNLQLLTPEENFAKERPDLKTVELPCNMKKPLQYYLDKCNYWLLEYEREKQERSSATKRADKCRHNYCVFRKKIRYWFSHQNEYEDYIKLESARVSAQDYQKERLSKIKQYKQEIEQAKEISKELWRQKIKEYNTFLENVPFKTAEELEKLYLSELNCN